MTTSTPPDSKAGAPSGGEEREKLWTVLGDIVREKNIEQAERLFSRVDEDFFPNDEERKEALRFLALGLQARAWDPPVPRPPIQVVVWPPYPHPFWEVLDDVRREGDLSVLFSREEYGRWIHRHFDSEKWDWALPLFVRIFQHLLVEERVSAEELVPILEVVEKIVREKALFEPERVVSESPKRVVEIEERPLKLLGLKGEKVPKVPGVVERETQGTIGNLLIEALVTNEGGNATTREEVLRNPELIKKVLDILQFVEVSPWDADRLLTALVNAGYPMGHDTIAQLAYLVEREETLLRALVDKGASKEVDTGLNFPKIQQRLREEFYREWAAAKEQGSEEERKFFETEAPKFAERIVLFAPPPTEPDGNILVNYRWFDFGREGVYRGLYPFLESKRGRLPDIKGWTNFYPENPPRLMWNPYGYVRVDGKEVPYALGEFRPNRPRGVTPEDLMVMARAMELAPPAVITGVTMKIFDLKREVGDIFARLGAVFNLYGWYDSEEQRIGSKIWWMPPYNLRVMLNRYYAYNWLRGIEPSEDGEVYPRGVRYLLGKLAALPTTPELAEELFSQFDLSKTSTWRLGRWWLFIPSVFVEEVLRNEKLLQKLARNPDTSFARLLILNSGKIATAVAERVVSGLSRNGDTSLFLVAERIVDLPDVGFAGLVWRVALSKEGEPPDSESWRVGALAFKEFRQALLDSPGAKLTREIAEWKSKQLVSYSDVRDRLASSPNHPLLDHLAPGDWESDKERRAETAEILYEDEKVRYAIKKHPESKLAEFIRDNLPRDKRGEDWPWQEGSEGFMARLAKFFGW